MSVLPPRAAQSPRILFLASAVVDTTTPIARFNIENNSLACSKSPNMVRNDVDHPEPTDSLTVPKSWVKVFTEVADSLPRAPSRSISFACSLV